MSQQKRLEKIGATPGKLALIAVLACVLVFVIVSQLPSQNTPSQPSVKRKQNSAATAEQNDPPENNTVDQQNKVVRKQPAAPWPQLQMSDLLQTDPFKKPKWATQSNEALQQTQDAGVELAELQKQGASVVMITSKGKSATIGDRDVHVGDILKGYRITDITAQGIVLHKLGTD